jgi:hypothetical protein
MRLAERLDWKELTFYCQDNFVLLDPTRKKSKYHMIDIQMHYYTWYFVL